MAALQGSGQSVPKTGTWFINLQYSIIKKYFEENTTRALFTDLSSVRKRMENRVKRQPISRISIHVPVREEIKYFL